MSCSGDFLDNSAHKIDRTEGLKMPTDRDKGMFQQRRDVMFALNFAPSQKHINYAFFASK